ncbi:hypothetical protein CALCODRAFT_35733 [Calocera cornea HHB12733]|uniref:Uncharacterized protein n=1 Tax=Calocera cornea HHB12733 TaxID=1353952 RepID=A0A165E0R2_9BASI|nr:hypothetical protein CALCODRAFT_35733 [Calocera cornea HHB12733]
MSPNSITPSPAGLLDSVDSVCQCRAVRRAGAGAGEGVWREIRLGGSGRGARDGGRAELLVARAARHPVPFCSRGGSLVQSSPSYSVCISSLRCAAALFSSVARCVSALFLPLLLCQEHRATPHSHTPLPASSHRDPQQRTPHPLPPANSRSPRTFSPTHALRGGPLPFPAPHTLHIRLPGLPGTPSPVPPTHQPSQDPSFSPPTPPTPRINHPRSPLDLDHDRPPACPA